MTVDFKKESKLKEMSMQILSASLTKNNQKIIKKCSKNPFPITSKVSISSQLN